MSTDQRAVKPPYLVSACLMGLCTRYDAKIVVSPKCNAFLKDSHWIPICPEQLGGLPTPRPAADILSGDGHDVLTGSARVCTKEGENLSTAFIHGARQVLHIAQSQPIQGVCLKARSPSCAISGTMGVTAALLQQHGITLHEF